MGPPRPTARKLPRSLRSSGPRSPSSRCSAPFVDRLGACCVCVRALCVCKRYLLLSSSYLLLSVPHVICAWSQWIAHLVLVGVSSRVVSASIEPLLGLRVRRSVVGPEISCYK